MAKYVDGFVIPISKKKVKSYQAIAKMASKVWMEHGALEYRECIGDDLNSPIGTPFDSKRMSYGGFEVIVDAK
ncbi:DUF1428 family protein [Bdellovibrio bacteriovorus]|uniref:DUF1428 family protein n=1 Tax=Bdellovibrio TaxID=958 RepID=UPI0035A91324